LESHDAGPDFSGQILQRAGIVPRFTDWKAKFVAERQEVPQRAIL
jgi:hypothetical protein